MRVQQCSNSWQNVLSEGCITGYDMCIATLFDILDQERSIIFWEPLLNVSFIIAEEDMKGLYLIIRRIVYSNDLFDSTHFGSFLGNSLDITSSNKCSN